ncbi:MAG: AmmeMemoRadiSam system protein B [Patescibacteria group bacterium]|nr:AmmeMemoRadiSam system protein B [Patescibacteria group bacterium]
MLKAKIFIAGVLVTMAGTRLYFFLTETKPPEIVSKYHHSQFFEYAQFIESSTEQAKSEEKIDLDLVLGGIISHDVPATIPLLSKFYTKLKNTREVKTFIILGPDHVDRGRRQISVSKATFITPFGQVLPNLEIIEKLEGSGFVVHDETPFDREHSIGSQLLLISKLFPEARIVPLVFRSNISNKTTRELGRLLAEIADDSTFVIASVDFSHYLSERQAKPLDYLSANVLGTVTSQFGGLVEADSTQALVALMSFLEIRGANYHVDLQILNTSDFSANRDFTTGYVSGFWGIKNELLNLNKNDSEITFIFVSDILLSRTNGKI